MNVIRRLVHLNRAWSKGLEERFPTFFAQDVPSYYEELMSRITAGISAGSVRSVLEIGGIDRPLLRKGDGFRYDGVDVEEKSACHDIYDRFHVQNVETMRLQSSFDLIISMTLLEHVPDVRSGIRSMHRALEPGGEMHHYVPSKWHPYAIALRIVGPVLQKKLIPVLRPGAETVSGYPAYFDHCTMRSMSRLLKDQGFNGIQMKAFYRANDYFAFFTPLFILITVFENICRKLGLTLFASGFVFSAEKKAGNKSG